MSDREARRRKPQPPPLRLLGPTEGFGPTDGYNLAKTLADSATGQQLFNLLEQRGIWRDCALVPDRPLRFLCFGLERSLGMARAAAQFVEDEIAGDLQQPGRELCPRHIPFGTPPNPDKDLLGDVFDLGIVPQHPGDSSHHKPLMAFHQFLEGGGIPGAHEQHQPDVFGILV